LRDRKLIYLLYCGCVLGLVIRIVSHGGIIAGEIAPSIGDKIKNEVEQQ